MAQKNKETAEQIIAKVIARGVTELPIGGNAASKKWSFGIAYCADSKRAIFTWATFRFKNMTYAECVKEVKKLIKKRGWVVDKFYGLDATNIDF